MKHRSWIAIAALLVVACGGGGDAERDAGGTGGSGDSTCDAIEAATLSLGTTDATLVGWSPLVSGATLELVLGFQGLNFVPITVRLGEIDPEGLRLRVEIDETDTGTLLAEAATGFPQFTPTDGGGYLLDRALPIAFLDHDFCDVVGRKGDVRVTIDDRATGCRASEMVGGIVIRDEVQCVDFCGDLFPPSEGGDAAVILRYPSCGDEPVEVVHCLEASGDAGVDSCAR